MNLELFQNVYSFLFPILIYVSAYLLSWLFHKRLNHKKIISLEEALRCCEKEVRVCHTSYQYQKQFQTEVKERQKEQMSAIASILEDLRKQYVHLLEPDQEELFQVCIKRSKALTNGVWNPMVNEAVDLKTIIEELQQVFAERIYKSKTNIEMHFQGASITMGDSLFIKMILANAFGKAIYRTPLNGNVHVSVQNREGWLHIEIYDTGYELSPTIEALLKEACDLFLEQNILHQVCRDYGLEHYFSRTKGGLHMTWLAFPCYSDEISQDLRKHSSVLN